MSKIVKPMTLDEVFEEYELHDLLDGRGGLPPIWEGSDYATGGLRGKKVMILGESTYEPRDGNPRHKWAINLWIARGLMTGPQTFQSGIFSSFMPGEFRDDMEKVLLEVGRVLQLHYGTAAPLRHASYSRDVEVLSPAIGG